MFATSVSGLMLVVSTAHGEPQSRGSFRDQVMRADGIAATTVAASAFASVWLFSPDDFHLPLTIAGFGGTGYVLTAPIIHFAHGRVGRGLASGTLRVVAPALVAGLSDLVDRGSQT